MDTTDPDAHAGKGNGRDCYDRFSLFVLTATLVCLGIYTIYTIFQYNTIVDTERRTLRSYIAPTNSIEFGPRQRQFSSIVRAFLTIENTGQTPASSVSIVANFQVGERLTKEDEVSSFNNNNHPTISRYLGTIYPKTTDKIEVTPSMTGFGVDEAKKNMMESGVGPGFVFIWGKITYTDAFSCHRVTQFCQIYRAAHLSSNQKAQFVECDREDRASRIEDQGKCEP